MSTKKGEEKETLTVMNEDATLESFGFSASTLEVEKPKNK